MHAQTSIGLTFPIDDIECEDIARREAHRKRYERVLREHPDPRDPEYPGEWEEE